jgi:putative membrane protein
LKNTMKSNISGVALLLLALAACHSGSSNATSKDSTASVSQPPGSPSQDSANISGPVSLVKGDQDFLMSVADGGMTEIQASQAAQNKTVNPRVRDFAAMMVRDHSRWGDQLKTLAQARNVSLPAAVSSRHQAAIDALQKYQGAAFDKHYIDMMVHDHEGAVHDFETVGSAVRDTALARFVREKLPLIRMHLDSAKAIAKAL